MAGATPAQIEPLIRSIGLYRAKAKNCVGLAQAVVQKHGGDMPHTMAELTRLPGIGRKSANIVLTQGFGICEGIAVDTHVFRIAHRLQLAPQSADTPEKVERSLLKLVPRAYWSPLNHQWVMFGRETCPARAPRCPECPIAKWCPSCSQTR
jgi:endonuclease-3